MFAWGIVLVVVLLLFGPILFNMLGPGSRREQNEDPAWIASEPSRHEAIDAVHRRRRETRRAA